MHLEFPEDFPGNLKFENQRVSEIRWSTNQGSSRNFLDISKAFDKVWHAGVIFKLKANSVEGKFVDIFKQLFSKPITAN